MEEPIKQHFNQPTGLSIPGSIDILKESWLIYKARIKTFLGIAIIPSLIILALMIFSLVFGFSGNLPEDLTKDSLFFGFFSFWLVLFVIVSVVIQSWAEIALIYAVKDNQEGIGIKESYKRALPKIIPFLWVSFLSGIIIMGGLLFFIIPGIIFALWFCFSVFVLIDENLKGTQAISKSKDYVSGMMGIVFWRLLFIVLIIMVIIFFSSFFPGGILTPIVSFLLTPLITIYHFLVYKKIKEAKNIKQY